MECQLQPMADARRLEDPPVPEGHVEQVCREWLVREDGVLAYRLQSQEIEQHYDKNRFHNRLVRTDLQQARCLQSNEEEEAEIVRKAYEKMLLDQEAEDERVAKQIQEQLLEEEIQRQRIREAEDERLARQLQEKEKLRLERKKREKEQERENQEVEKAHSELLAKGIITPPDEDLPPAPFETSSGASSPVLPPPPVDQVDDDFTDFLLPPPPGISDEEMSKYQEDQDAELARLLQEQETKRRGQTYRDRQLAIEAQDRELAKVLQEQERARAKRARERARQRAFQQQQQKQLQQDMEKIEELHCPPSCSTLGEDDTVSQTASAADQLWYRDSDSIQCDDDGASTSGYAPESVPNIAVALDPTYNRRKASLECHSSSSSKPTSPMQSPVRSAEQSPDASPYRNGMPSDYFDDRILEEGGGGGESPVPPYMPIQGTRRTSSLEKAKKPKKQKNGCRTQ